MNFDANADTAEPVILRLASGHLSKEDLTLWLRTVIHEKPSMEVREFFAAISSHTLAEMFHAFAHPGLREAQIATYLEAGKHIPAIHQAHVGAKRAEDEGNAEISRTLRQHAILLTILYRIAEDMGYEW